MTSENSSKILDFKTAIIIFIFFAAFIGILLWGGNYLSEHRYQKYYASYSEEIDDYVNQNRTNVMIVFNQIFPVHGGCTPRSTGPDACPDEELISKMMPISLKDGGSIEFLKEVNGKIYWMDISGNSREFYTPVGRITDNLNRLLQGEVESIPIDSYRGYQTKQIIIPVKDDSGKLVGAIATDVIDK